MTNFVVLDLDIGLSIECITTKYSYMILYSYLKNSFLYNAVAAAQRCSKEKVLWKYAENLEENTHAKV